MKVQSSFIYNRQLPETTQKSVDRRMIKPAVVEPHNGILLSNRKHKQPAHTTTCRPSVTLSEEAKAQHTLYDSSTYMKLWKLQPNF